MNKAKGFTLIELLIVITIIGILAVAFLPTILNAPSKARDTKRIADLEKIQKVLVAADLESLIPSDIPYDSAHCINNDQAVDEFDIFAQTALGGVIPLDPKPENPLPFDPGDCDSDSGRYVIVFGPGANTYKFGVYAKIENPEMANASCNALIGGNFSNLISPAEDVGDACYAVLVK